MPRHMAHHMAQVQGMMLERMVAMAVLVIINMVETAVAVMVPLHNKKPHLEIPLPTAVLQRLHTVGVTTSLPEEPNAPMEELKPHPLMVDPGVRRLNNQLH